ncbi:MAG TPA: hypothetical protein VKB65_00590, partial [Myxococcota bacterium]|nr:hypothetical protein [Myxococcota bacterium]
TIDLNRIDYVRTALAAPDAPPSVVLILVPGFLGGAGTFDPIARDLVREFNGSLEVWAVDRRPQQLEDRRGALYARAGAEAAGGDVAAARAAIARGVRFYFPGATIDLDPPDGADDGPFPLPDAKPGDGESGFQKLSQNDTRGFQAHWGVDTCARDWRELVLAARAVVGEEGLVLFGGHSMGTTWTGVFAAYDFDVGPGVEAGYQLVDGLVLLEGGGVGPPSASAPDLSTYEAAIADLETPDGGDVFLQDLFGFVDATNIGAAGELNGVAGTFDPDGESLVQTTPVFGGIPVSILLQAPMTNRSIVGFFLDDDFSTNSAFSASIGFSANGSNVFNPVSFLVPGSFYLAVDEGVTRTWIDYDSPRFDPGDADPLVCPPQAPPPEPTAVGDTGCAIIDNGPKPAPGLTGQWGVEREVTDVAVLLRTLYETGNASEWYFTSGRVNLDLSFGRDSSALGAPELLNVTQNANVDVPIVGIGGSNGLATTEASFAGYMDSTASSDKQVVILEGYAHLDTLTAEDNEAVPVLVDWINHVRQQKLLSP